MRFGQRLKINTVILCLQKCVLEVFKALSHFFGTRNSSEFIRNILLILIAFCILCVPILESKNENVRHYLKLKKT